LRKRDVSLSSKLPRTWLLQSRIDVTKDGKRHPDPMLGEDPVALLIYGDTGHFSAQFMKRDRSTVALVAALPNAKNNTQAQGGYDGDSLVITLETTAADGTPVVRTLTWRRQ
jgi:hypothetical protein